MSSIGAAPRAAPINARAEASRRNGAKSHGPKTPEGKQRSSQNALKHGFRAQKCVVLPSESAAEFAALEAALIEELAPDGALQAVLAQRVVAATWRLARAERLEVQLFAENHLTGRSIGLALIRDCNGARSFDTLLRYRGGALAELWRALRTLKALQAEQAQAQETAPAPCAEVAVSPPAEITPELPVEPEPRRIPRQMPAPAPAHVATAPVRRVDAPQPAAFARAHPRDPAPPPLAAAGVAQENPIEPEARGEPGQTTPLPAASEHAGNAEARSTPQAYGDCGGWSAGPASGTSATATNLAASPVAAA